jgi:hypothetical protein
VINYVNILLSKLINKESVTEKYYAHLAPDFQREEIEKLNSLTDETLVNKWSAQSRHIVELEESLNKKIGTKMTVYSL